MALVLADRVLETTTTTGSGTITLAGAEPGYQSFSAVGNGNQTYYTITADTVWEVGIGTYTASGTTLSRDTVLSSSASGAKVTLPSGVKKVFVTYPSEKSVNLGVSGNISLSSAVISGVASPSIDSDAVNKLYVDTLVAQGITYHTPVKYEVPNTTGNLNATYNNGTAGVSATLTNAGTLGPFVPDGVTASISDRVLIYNQTNAFQNGVYTVTTVGTGASSWVLTRASDADTYALKSPNGLGQGDAFYVTSGNTGAGETYLCNTSGTITFGTTPINFVQISAAQVYSAGTGISLTNTTISLVSPVAVATGGTGTTATPTNGQLLIGNGSGYTLSTLTAGSGVSITNSAGSITLTATGTGGTVVAVTASAPLASTGGVSPNISIANSTGTGSVVLDQGATISSATITAGVSAAITTITGTSANITTVTGTTAGFSSANITHAGITSATVTTLSGTNVTYSSGTITQFGATSATITTLSGTNVSYPNANFTSATITNLALTSLTLANLSISSANITTLTSTNATAASLTVSTGNLAFSGTAQRITGDMSNATIANRLLFQNSVTNGSTTIGAIPNGTGQATAIGLYTSSSAGSASFVLRAGADTSDARLAAGTDSTGVTPYPMTFYTGGSERMRLDTSGNLLVGTATSVGGVRLTSVGGGVQLSGGTTAQEGVRIQRATGYATFTGINNDNNAYNGLQFFTGASAAATIDTSGNVGIGKSPTTKLDVSGTITGTAVSATDGSFTSATVTNLNSTSANIATLTGTTFGTTATTQLRGASGAITTVSGTTLTYTSGTITNLAATSLTLTRVSTFQINKQNTTGEGGEFYLEKSDTSTLAGNLVIDLIGNSLRFFENGGTARGTTLDISAQAAGASSVLLTSSNYTSYVGNGTLTMNVSGTGLSGSQTFTANQSGNATFTVTSNATSANTASAIVARDASGNFSMGVLYATGAQLTGDITTYRSGAPTTGVIYFGNSGARYLYYDGANYVMPGAELYVNGVQVVRNSGTWGISITGNAATVTTGMPNNTDNYMNFRVMRNSNTVSPADGMYIGYGNTFSGATRIFGAGSTSGHAYIDASGNWFRNDGVVYIRSDNISSFVSGLPTNNVTSSTSISAVAGNHYILRSGTAATVTLPASPAAGAVVWVTVANGLTTNVIARNGVNIQGLAEDMTLNSKYAAVQLRYSDATMGWVFC